MNSKPIITSIEEKKMDKIDLKKIFVEKYIKSLKFPQMMDAEKIRDTRKNQPV